MPANAKLLVDSLTAIATFDLVEAQTIFGDIIEFPDEDEEDLNPKFVESGYESAYMINLMGIGFVAITVVITLMLILLVMFPCRNYFAKV